MKNLPHILVISLIVIACSSDDSSPGEVLSETAMEFLESHNQFRSAVGVADLSWSETLEESAAEWAEELASNCSFEHSVGDYGENIWIGTADAFTIDDVVEAWGSEEQYYDYTDNSCEAGQVCGHYTQIVWESTTEVGCGTATCDGLDIWVCQYLPAGNIVGQRPY